MTELKLLILEAEKPGWNLSKTLWTIFWDTTGIPIETPKGFRKADDPEVGIKERESYDRDKGREDFYT